MKLKLFGNNINPNCNYCDNSKIVDGGIYCIKKKEIKNGKCRCFSYNPLLRKPNSAPKLNTYNEMDFVL